MRVVKILSMALIFFIFFILYIINNFSNIDNKYNCFLSKDVCVDRIIYNNNYYYNLYLNNRVKTEIQFRNENLFFVGFKEVSDKLYILVQESMMNNRKIVEECRRLNQPFKFSEDKYILNLYVLSSSGNKLSMKIINKEDSPQLIKEWVLNYRLNPTLEFIC